MSKTQTVLASAILGFSGSAIAGNTTYLSGNVNYTNFYLAPGDTVVATGDLCITCTSDAIIDGLLTAQHGVNVEINADCVFIAGTIFGGDGESGTAVDEDGEDGGDIILSGSCIEIERPHFEQAMLVTADHPAMVDMAALLNSLPVIR